MFSSCPVVGLGRRREERARKPVGLAQPRRQRNAADRARASVVLPSGAGEVAAHDALEREHLEPPHEQRAAGEPRVARALGKVAQLGRDDVIANDVRREREPVEREGREHPALVGDRRREDDVERRDAIRGDQQKPPITGVVELPHLAGGEMVERERARHELPPGDRMRRRRCAVRRPGRRCDRA